MSNKFILTEYRTFDNDHQELLTEAEKLEMANGSVMYLTGVMQRADAENGNGRVYPADILEREVENYKKLVKENRSYGELDHPDCMRPTAEILTDKGWLSFNELSMKEEVCTLNKETGDIEYQKINKIFDRQYKGQMIEFKGRNLKTLVTPHHRFWVINRYGKGSFVKASEILDNRSKFNKSYIPKLGNWRVKEVQQITIVGVGREDLGYRCRKDLVEKYQKDFDIDADVFSKFMGIYLSEGSVDSTGESYQILITQNEGKNADKIRELLKSFPQEISWYEKSRINEFGNTNIQFAVHDARLHKYLIKLGKSHEKYLPKEIKNMSPKNLSLFLEWFVIGDGRIRKSDGFKATEVFSTSKKLINDLHEILIKTGKSGNIFTRIPENRMIGERLIKAENSRPIHFLHFSTTRGIYLDERFMKMKKVNYDDRVCCVNVDNEIFYARDEGKAFWSGNSPIVELQKASHFVTHIEMKGKEVIGKIKLMDTDAGRNAQGIVRSGGMLSISSRGLGSTTQKNGKTYVKDDYQLVCFDLVSEPSTAGAYMLKEGKVPFVDEKGDRINRALNNVLRSWNK